MEENLTVRITGYVSPGTRRLLRLLAAQRGVKVTVLIREAIDRYLKDDEVSRDVAYAHVVDSQKEAPSEQ